MVDLDSETFPTVITPKYVNPETPPPIPFGKEEPLDIVRQNTVPLVLCDSVSKQEAAVHYQEEFKKKIYERYHHQAMKEVRGIMDKTSSFIALSLFYASIWCGGLDLVTIYSKHHRHNPWLLGVGWSDMLVSCFGLVSNGYMIYNIHREKKYLKREHLNNYPHTKRLRTTRRPSRSIPSVSYRHNRPTIPAQPIEPSRNYKGFLAGNQKVKKVKLVHIQ